MRVSRRGLWEIARGRSSASGLVIAARGREAEQSGRGAPRSGPPPGVDEIRINSNENPLGPGKVALDAILDTFPDAGRYPFNSAPNDTTLTDTIAALHKTKADNVVLGAGSQEILRNAIRAFTSPFRPLVTAAPTFENCTALAHRMGHPVHEVKVDSSFRLNLEDMLAAVRGAGLVYLNNPNNPTATVHSANTIADFVERVRRISPDTVILIDEAYHDYVIDPGYATAIRWAVSSPNVLVARTFSKAYGMAGMRIGFAIGEIDTIKPLSRLKMPYNVSVLGIAAAIAALKDPAHIAQERARNTQARALTVKAFETLGCKVTDSQTNFIFVDVGRPAGEFRDACAKAWVSVGRDFPPFAHSHVRVSIGTMDEMRRAIDVFRDVLRPAVPASSTAVAH
jgi:histidinol-phosphate aminotransferase